jgi:23S rRNA (cytidine1920-2'-O)/16S rRNA (cytidine1409-2'-O)-methyltransferase
MDAPDLNRPAKLGAQRLDLALVDRGICESREKAQRAILAGQVRVNQQVVTKASAKTYLHDQIELEAAERYVGRGGYKLERALDVFQLDVTGKVVLDLGASTGGFTDCLLQRGAQRVYAVDVGKGQLAWKLRQDPRVVVMEGVNARHLVAQDFSGPAPDLSLVVIDCSFISLRHILPVASRLLSANGRVVALIKPQFEAGKAEADRGAGVIRDPAVHDRVLAELKGFVAENGVLRWSGTIESPILGAQGNKEFLVLLEKTA